MLKLTDKGGPTVEAGSYNARCIQVLEIGTHTNTYGNAQQQVQLVFELPDVLTEEGMPRTRFITYTASLGKKANLRKHLANWRGRDFTDEELKGFTLNKLLGQPAMVTINDKGYISSVTAIPKGTKVAEPVHPLLYLEIFPQEDGSAPAFDQSVFDELNEKLQQRIAESSEFQELVSSGIARPLGAAVNQPTEEAMPF